MTDDLDRKLGGFLRAAGVPERDPFFRLGVLERRADERYRLRRKNLFVIAGVLAALHAVFFALAYGLGVLESALVLVFGLALLGALFASARGVVQAWRWLRGT